MSKCPCCSKINYEICCKMYHDEQLIPKTPEAMMRSRYSAYAMANINYIKNTMQGKPLEAFNEIEAKTWAQKIKWIKLTIINTVSASPEHGFVEFVARFIENGQHRNIHEVSEFRLIDGRWFYVDDIHPAEN